MPYWTRGPERYLCNPRRLSTEQSGHERSCEMDHCGNDGRENDDDLDSPGFGRFDTAQ
jgi:hypothetical protein